MARKRRLEVRSPEEEHQEEDDVHDVRSDRDIAIEGTWTEWFKKVFVKYCYAILVLFLACVVPLEVHRQLHGDLGLGAAFLALLIIVPLGLFGYLRIWGDNGLWGPEQADDF